MVALAAAATARPHESVPRFCWLLTAPTWGRLLSRGFRDLLLPLVALVLSRKLALLVAVTATGTPMALPLLTGRSSITDTLRENECWCCGKPLL